MNTSILRKVLTEVSKESPDLSYVRGMLETLLDLSEADGQAFGAEMLRPAAKMMPFSQKDYGTLDQAIKSLPEMDSEPKSPAQIAAEEALFSISTMPQPKPSGYREVMTVL